MDPINCMESLVGRVLVAGLDSITKWYSLRVEVNLEQYAPVEVGASDDLWYFTGSRESSCPHSSSPFLRPAKVI